MGSWVAVGPGRMPYLALGLSLPTVGEEDEVSIQQAAEAVMEAMDFHGEVTVSFGCGRACRASLHRWRSRWQLEGRVCCCPQASPGRSTGGQGQAGGWGWGGAAPSAVALTRCPV